MNGLFDAAREMQRFFQARDWSFCVIGGIAVLRWGEVRMTQDVDLALLTGFGEEERYIKELLASFQSRIPDAEQFALQYRVLLLSASNGTPVDISFAGLPFEQEMMQRATSFAYAPECILMTCSAEDLVVLKAFANRDKDWLDVEGILLRQSQSLDFEYIMKQLTPFCEFTGNSEILLRLRQRMKKNQQ